MRLNPVPLLLGVVATLFCGCVLLSGGPQEILGAAPLLALLAALAFGRYPGERLIERLAARRRLPRPVRVARPSRARSALVPRLLAALAGCRALRAPPARSLALS